MYFLSKFYMPPAHSREARFAGLCGIVACLVGFCNGACGLVLRVYGERDGNGIWSGFGLVFVGMLGILIWWSKLRQLMVLYLVLSVMSFFVHVIQVAMASIQLAFWRHFEVASSHCYMYLGYCRCTTYDAKKLPISLSSCDLIYKFDDLYAAVITMSVLGVIISGTASFIGCLSTCFDGSEKDETVTMIYPPESNIPVNDDSSTEVFVTASSREGDRYFYWSPQALPRSLSIHRPEIHYWSPQPPRNTRLQDATPKRSRELVVEQEGELQNRGFLRSPRNQKSKDYNLGSKKTGTKNNSFDDIQECKSEGSTDHRLQDPAMDCRSTCSSGQAVIQDKQEIPSGQDTNNEEIELDLVLFDLPTNDENRKDCLPLNEMSHSAASLEEQAADDTSGLPTYEDVYLNSFPAPTLTEEMYGRPSQEKELESQSSSITATSLRED